MVNYFITVFNRYDDYGPHDCRCWGYYTNIEDAIDVLVNNLTDLWEGCYHYGVIEAIGPGISPYAKPRWFYKYNKHVNMYQLINEPEGLKHFCNFAIG
jgi:hypothetical protein